MELSTDKELPVFALTVVAVCLAIFDRRRPPEQLDLHVCYDEVKKLLGRRTRRSDAARSVAPSKSRLLSPELYLAVTGLAHLHLCHRSCAARFRPLAIRMDMSYSGSRYSKTGADSLEHDSSQWPMLMANHTS